MYFLNSVRTVSCDYTYMIGQNFSFKEHVIVDQKTKLSAPHENVLSLVTIC